MNAQTDIKEIQSYPFAWKEKANEIIKRLNLKTVVRVYPEGICQSAKVDIGEDKITISITLRTFKAQVCDSDTGEQSEYELVGMKVEGDEVED